MLLLLLLLCTSALLCALLCPPSSSPLPYIQTQHHPAPPCRPPLSPRFPSPFQSSPSHSTLCAASEPAIPPVGRRRPLSPSLCHCEQLHRPRLTAPALDHRPCERRSAGRPGIFPPPLPRILSLHRTRPIDCYPHRGDDQRSRLRDPGARFRGRDSFRTPFCLLGSHRMSA